MNFDEAIAADTLGLLLPESLPKVATDALVAGYDSDALAALAGETPRTTSSELHALFAKALSELGASRPSPLDAAAVLARYYAREVLGGRLTPGFGALAIARILEAIPPALHAAEHLQLGELATLHLDYDVLRTEGYGSATELDRIAIECFHRILGAPAA